MIILMHPKYQQWADDMMGSDGQGAFMTEARIPNGTRILFDRNLPEEDDEGNPIFAFKVSGGETHYWSGEPIKMPWK